MRITPVLACTLFLSLALAACSGVQVQQGPIEQFSAGHYRYYEWRSEPLPSKPGSTDPVHIIDPILRQEVDAALQGKGYVLDPSRAQFTVDYRYLTEMVDGERSALASNIDPHPRVIPNRQMSPAVVDNAIALGGVKQTNNIILQFIDKSRNQEVWEVMLSRIVEDANTVDTSHLDNDLRTFVKRALGPLPEAPAQ